jgi:pimeloyl-ACP methyl ester carboxylesterase
LHEEELMMSKIASAAALAGALLSVPAQAQEAPKPTIVLVHGAFADSSGWNDVTKRLIDNGYTVVAAANPLRSVKADADQVSHLIKSIANPVVLVGHSYGGAVISIAANGNPNVKALVFVAAFAPDRGEAAGQLAGKFPGGTLGEALAPPVKLPGGGVDLYIDQSKFHSQFAHDIPADKAAVMASSQRPIAEAALTEAAGEPAWKALPSWFIYGSGDKNIPAAGLAFMAERAGSSKTVVIEGASHVPMVSHPQAVADLIGEAAEQAESRGRERPRK